MDFYAALNNFRSTLEPKITQFVTTILPYVGLFTLVIMVVFVGYKVVKSFMSEERLETSTLLRPCLTLAALALYPDLVDLLIETPVDIINEIVIEGSSSVGGAAPGELKGMRDKMMYVQSTGGDEGGGVYDIIQIHPFLELIHVVVLFIASIAGGYILFRQLIMKSLYMIIGPFALAFSLIAGNEKTLDNWFQGFFSILLWIPVLSIVQTIIILIPVETTDFSSSDIIYSVAIQIVMIFTVFKVPKYANILVTHGSDLGSQFGGNIKSRAESWLNNKSMAKSMGRGK